jgi:hypothetical protein
VLPVTGLVIALVALAMLLVPGFRDQVRLSTTRESQPFVELYFPQSPSAAEARCPTGGGPAEVRFTVVSHLDRVRQLAYFVSVEGAGEPVEKRGQVRIEPGQSRLVRTALDVPSAATVTVRLPGRDQLLRAHCPGATS